MKTVCYKSKKLRISKTDLTAKHLLPIKKQNVRNPTLNPRVRQSDSLA